MLTVVQSIRQSKKPIITFCHGLGDFVNFLPVFFELQRQTGKKIDICASKKRQLNLIYPKMIDSEDNEHILKNYDYFYRVHYPEPETSFIPPEYNKEPAKPYICAYKELGMNKFVWKPFKLSQNYNNIESIRVGVHFFGHTSMAYKGCPLSVAEQIWKEIEECGFEPFEIHMRPQFRKDYKEFQSDTDIFPLATPENSIRFETPSLHRMKEEIEKCAFFIGVDSGPLYFANAILGPDRVIGIEKEKFINNYLPVHISTCSIKHYVSGSIKEQLETKKGNI